MSLLSGYAWCAGRTGKVRSTWPGVESLERVCLANVKGRFSVRPDHQIWRGILLGQFLCSISWEVKEPNLTTDTHLERRAKESPKSFPESQGSWCNTHWMTPVPLYNVVSHLFWERLELVFRIHVLPDALHVVPVLHYAMLHRVSDRKKTSVLLSRQKGQESIRASNNHASEHCDCDLLSDSTSVLIPLKDNLSVAYRAKPEHSSQTSLPEKPRLDKAFSYQVVMCMSDICTAYSILTLFKPTHRHLSYGIFVLPVQPWYKT